MKKIKSIKHLKGEKKRLIQCQENLEKKIQHNWHQLKEYVKPTNIARYAIARVMNNKSQAKINDESILKSTITFGATLFAKRFLDKAGEKLDRFFKH